MPRTPLYELGRDFDSLTDKRQAFVNEYLIDFNSARAAKAAGYKNSAVMGARLAKDPIVKRVIGKYRKDLLKSGEIDREEIIKQINYGLTRSVKDLVDNDGKIIQNLKDLPDSVAHTIDGIDQDVHIKYDREGNITGETISTKMRLNKKAAYIDMAAKHIGFYEPEQHEMTHKMIDWESMAVSSKETKDPIEDEILAIGNG